MRQWPYRHVVAPTLIYAILGLFWIHTTDHLLAHLTPNIPTLTYFSIMKGDLFVLITATLLSLFLLRELRHRTSQTEQIRRQIEEQRMLLETTMDAFCAVDTHGRLLDANNACSQMLGYSRSELLQMSVSALEVIETPEDTARHLERIIATGFDRFETRHRRKDGQIIDVEASVTYVPTHREQFFCFMRDITKRKHAEQTLAAHTNQLEAVRSVTLELTQELRLPQVLALIIQRAVELLCAHSGVVYLWNEATQDLTPAAWSGLEGDWIRDVRIPLGRGLTGSVAMTRQGMIVNNCQTWPEANPLFLTHTKIVATLAEPFLYADRLIGVITINSDDASRLFTDQDREVVALFAGHAAIAIENARLYEATVRRGEALAALLRATQSVMSGLDLHEILNRIARAASEIAGTPHVAVMLVDREAQALRMATVVGDSVPSGYHVPLGVSFSGLVAESGEPLFCADSANDPRNASAERDRQLGFVTYLGLPIKIGDEVLGVLSFDTTEPREYGVDELAYLSSFAGQTAIAIENARLYEAAQQELAKHRRTQTALMQSETRYRRLIETAAEGIIISDPDTLITFVNPKMAAMLGYTPAEMLGRSYTDFVDPTERPDARAAMARRHIAGNEQLERVFQRKDGTPCVMLLNVAPILDEGGQYAGGFAMFTDITARKNAETALATRTRHLEAIRTVSTEITRELDLTRLLQLIAQRALDLAQAQRAVIFYCEKTTNTFQSAAWAGFEDAEGQPWFPAEVARPNRGAPGEVLRQRRGFMVNDYREWPDANPALLAHTPVTRVLAEPLWYRDTIIGIILIGRDGETAPLFTNEHRETLSLFADQAAIAIENARLFQAQQAAYADLQRAQDELVRTSKLRALGQLSAGIAHDLNNVLASVIAHGDLLRFLHPSPELQHHLDPLLTSARDGALIIQRLQEFSRQQASKQLRPIRLETIVSGAVQLTRPHWHDEAYRHNRAITVETHLDDLPPILGSESEIREALTNLILNAVDAMPTGGCLTFRAQAVPSTLDVPGSPPAVDLQVTDTGTGIPEDVRPHIFDPFFTTRGTRGTGMGLSIVYGIMERHGGHITVTSTPGRGTTFTLWFQATQHQTTVTPEITIHPTTRPLRVLVVDDNPQVRHGLVSLLNSLGHIPTEADSGEAGLARLTDTPIDLLVTDLTMTNDMNGIQFAQQVRSMHPTTPIILITGWADATEDQDIPQGTINAILQKPIGLQQLSQIIEAHRPPLATLHPA
ncbi:MAG: GAF domain-containing protein [Candidatus Methylomirabilales bacterium]